MTLIVEDGSIVSGANTYVSAADLTAYATARGITISGDEEQLIIQSMDYIEAQEYAGYIVDQDQALKFPRSGIYYDQRLLSSTEIPTQLKNGQCETALAIDAGNSPLADVERNTRREKVGEVEIEYAQGTSSSVINRKISNALAPLLRGGWQGWQCKVSKA